jgi:hypothetical protein
MNATKAHKKGTRSHDDVEEDDELEEDGNSRQRLCQSCLHSRKDATRIVWLRAMTVEENATSVVEGRGRNANNGGDNGVRYHTQTPAGCAQPGGVTHRCEAKVTATTDGRRDRMQRRGRNQNDRTTERVPQMRGASTDK